MSNKNKKHKQKKCLSTSRYDEALKIAEFQERRTESPVAPHQVKFYFSGVITMDICPGDLPHKDGWDEFMVKLWAKVSDADISNEACLDKWTIEVVDD